MSEINEVELRPCFLRQLAAFAWASRWKWLLVFVTMLLALGLYYQSTIRQLLVVQQASETEKIQIHLGGFSPDNSMIVYGFCRAGTCYVGLLDLQTGAVTKIAPSDPDEWWASGRFSPSGKYLAFAVKRKSENSRWSQLGLYDLKTGTLKKLTDTQSHKEFPSFSPDEKRLIYAQANWEREKSGKTRFSDWDIYELEIENRQERRLTNYDFFLIGSPFYMPDGRRFIFSGDAPHVFGGKIGREARIAYKEKYQDNTIFILGQEATELRPAFTNGKLSNSPMISRDGKRIIYESRSDDLDRLAGEQILGYTYDLFMFEDGQHRRLTKLKYALLDYAISPDGSQIAYFSDPEGNGEIQLWLLNGLTNQLKKIETATDTLFQKNRSTTKEEN